MLFSFLSSNILLSHTHTHTTVRWFIYGIVLVGSAFKLKFWILPNLDNEKTGFVESFKPFYSVEWAKGKKSKKSKGSKSKEIPTETLSSVGTSNGSGEVSCLVEGKSEEVELPPDGNQAPLLEQTAS